MLRVLKPGGLPLLQRSLERQWSHRYPVDCWRFYPDAGQALAAWGRRSGFSCVLLESFVAARVNSHWNDFVAVFARDEAAAPRHARRMWESLPDAVNILNREPGGTLAASRPVELTEDMRLLYLQDRRLAELQTLLTAEQNIRLRLEAELARLRAAPPHAR